MVYDVAGGRTADRTASQFPFWTGLLRAHMQAEPWLETSRPTVGPYTPLTYLTSSQTPQANGGLDRSGDLPLQRVQFMPAQVELPHTADVNA